uniref:Radical SAM core domain-containing protein n=1 Tax=Populus trichocarpa TaxID=3694 RepID=A0A2K1ZJT8_POPTR
MGEPLENIDSVIKAANIMVHDQGLHFTPRKVTVSTSGLVPQLKHFLHESNCALAVSLNATTDEWYFVGHLTSLKSRCLLYLSSVNNMYAIQLRVQLDGNIPSCVDDAKRLVDIVQGIPCKINLVQFNPHCGSQFRPTSAENMIKFRNILAGAKCSIQTPSLRVPEQFQMAVNA